VILGAIASVRKTDYRNFLTVRFGSVAATEYNSSWAAGFGHKQPFTGYENPAARAGLSMVRSESGLSI